MTNSANQMQSQLPDQAQPKSYHHGDLRRALLDAALLFIEQKGAESLSMREVAKYAGVSPAAPFRHFSTRTSLLTAVAEEAMDRLALSVKHVLEGAHDLNPVQQFRAIGVGFLTWAFQNPTHFQVISSRTLIDFEGSSLRQRNDLIRTRMVELMTRASDAGLLRPGNPLHHVIAARAMAYGLARMFIDGQFPSWGLESDRALEQSIEILDQFMCSISVGVI